ncbi:hypothetical protein CEUSTIGMA_g6631.t1 [Chlamydomonas eustigma]|uniref:Nucleotide-diphospho-sugar transferase domain-containing protein n=1 Tax=Chlamydomonas eustigma TaxID=1157962 RepID=A0A250X7X7_9CHLO|nr:hypothetical protein CEUSTIGMA_g6631.t1 [Chlamydomonas eustigma]|eukprot:GAX79191.1 hypothetical protein CEUSTIGMA_g6631.t1 [Chlamydomonas eustigma]
MPALPRPRRGVALGVLGLMLLAFFSLVFMLGRQSYFHDIYETLTHDPRVHNPNAEHSLAPSGSAKDKLTMEVDNENRTAAASQPSTDAKPAETKPASPVASPTESVKKAEVVPNQKVEEVVKIIETVNKTVEKISESKPIVVTETAKSPAPTETGKGDGLSAMDNKYKPTKEMVQSIQQDGFLVVTWANWHYQDFVMTWVAHVQKVGITGYIVGAMDDQLLEALVSRKMNTFSMKSGLTLGDFGWGSKTFAKMGREKIRLIGIFLKLGVDVVIADVDVLWLRNPLPFFKKYHEADVLTSSDHLSNTVPDESLEKWPQAASAANIGIMLFRVKSLPFVNEWIDIIEKDETVWDQNAFNSLFRKSMKELPSDPNHYFMGYDGTLKMGILPVSLFCSGHTFFTQQMFKTLNLQPYAVHATFQFSGTPGKRNRMREFMLYEDPQSYYDHPAGFVTFEMDGIETLLPGAGPNTGTMVLENVQGHFKLVNHQILRVRNALAISSVLGRALVMPEMWCGQDRWWAPHSGVIPGSSFKLPFKCPMDHVFDLEGGWAGKLSEEQHGPQIPFREYSFFQNPRMLPEVNKSRLTIEICPANTAGCSDGSTAAAVQDGKIRVQEGLMSAQLKVALEAASSFKVLQFTTMNNAFKNFTKESDWSKFAARMRNYGSIWCCIHAHPGHIHYDMLWDVPHSDKFNRPWTTWETKTGP